MNVNTFVEDGDAVLTLENKEGVSSRSNDGIPLFNLYFKGEYYGTFTRANFSTIVSELYSGIPISVPDLNSKQAGKEAFYEWPVPVATYQEYENRIINLGPYVMYNDETGQYYQANSTYTENNEIMMKTLRIKAPLDGRPNASIGGNLGINTLLKNGGDISVLGDKPTPALFLSYLVNNIVDKVASDFKNFNQKYDDVMTATVWLSEDLYHYMGGYDKLIKELHNMFPAAEIKPEEADYGAGSYRISATGKTIDEKNKRIVMRIIAFFLVIGFSLNCDAQTNPNDTFFAEWQYSINFL